ncbi:MAG: hypothetical protein S4CHLAM7_08010 [Chlamydiae bacterium]|nr:hypothetical protein [Chlamydiota bacterium]
MLGKTKMNLKKRGYPCPCCGFLTRSESSHGTFEICLICNWEDDNVQFNDPDFKGGANKVSLNEAKGNYKKFRASSMKYLNEVRSPMPDEIP